MLSPRSIGFALGCLVVMTVCELIAAHEQDINNVEWWKKTTFYHVYVRSFKDSDGNGEGDINGITEKLDYLELIGAGTILMSPFYDSPLLDGGYDVSNYTDILPRFGTMDDFDRLVAQIKQRNMHMVIDFIPNHTSNQHPWFKCSERALFDPDCAKYKDYYVWSSSKQYEDSYPNDWINIFGGSPAWTWSPVREEFYYHQFLAEQPDLNLRSPDVREELKEVVRFWFRRGVDGIRVDAVPYFLEDEQLRDEPLNPNWRPGDFNYDRLLHNYTKDLPGSPALMQDWHEVADEFSDKLIICEAYAPIPNLMAYHGPNPQQRWTDMPFNFFFSQMGTSLEPRQPNVEGVNSALNDWLTALRDINWPRERGAPSPWAIWVTGNHDNPRLINRVGKGNHDAFKMISYMALGTPTDYYGDELGMTHSDANEIPKQTLAEHGEPSRHIYRSPMSWTADKVNVGFSSSNSVWMSLSGNFRTNNVETMLNAEGKNNLKNFIQINQLRKEYIETLVFGDLVLYNGTSIFAMARTHDQFGNLLLVANFDDHLMEYVRLRPQETMYSSRVVKPPRRARVVMVNFETETFDRPYEERIREDIEVDIQDLPLAPHQAVLLSY